MPSHIPKNLRAPLSITVLTITTEHLLFGLFLVTSKTQLYENSLITFYSCNFNIIEIKMSLFIFLSTLFVPLGRIHWDYVLMEISLQLVPFKIHSPYFLHFTRLQLLFPEMILFGNSITILSTTHKYY